MNKTVITERLIIRQMTLEDFPDFLEYAQDPDVVRHIREVEVTDVLKERFGGYADPWEGEESKWMGCAIELAESGKMIGDMGFRYRDKFSEIVEIGYKFNKHYHGKGYAFEAVKALVELIKADWPIHKLVAYADPENLASTKLLEKLSMVKEGHFKSHYKIGDKWVDEVAYGMLMR